MKQETPSFPSAPRPLPPAPPVSSWSVRALFTVRDAQARWQFAARSALCMALPVAIGWLTGHEAEGLIATLGAFTGLFGASHTYRRRAPLLAWAAFGFVVAVIISALGGATPWLGVLTVAAFGGVTVLICNSLRVGPPGAYMFVMACATGVSMHARGSPLLLDLLLVAGGGALAWLIQMSGVLIVPNGPQRRVVLAAARAVKAFVEALDTPGEDAARHLAATELHHAWEMLGDTVSTGNPFHAVSRRAHLLFAMANQRGLSKEKMQTEGEALLKAAHQLPVKQTQALLKSMAMSVTSLVPDRFTRRRAVDMLRDGLLLPHSEPRLNAIRAAVAAVIAGALGLTLGLEQAYWAVAAAVLVLHQGASRTGTLYRGIQRLLGTLAGLVLAEGLIALHPQGVWLVLLIAFLQFTIEITIVRNYALGVIFVTPISLLVATAVVPTSTNLILARGLDTLTGVVIAFVVLFMIGRRALKQRLPVMMADAFEAAQTVLDDLGRGDFTSTGARLGRVRLQQVLIDARTAYDYGMDESGSTRRAIEPYWASVVLLQRLGYEVLAACWAAEHAQKIPNLRTLQKALTVEKARCEALAKSGTGKAGEGGPSR